MDGLSGLKQFQQLSQQLGQQAASVGGDSATSGTSATGGASFKDMLMKSLNDVNSMQNDADTSLENYVSGKTQNVGEVISASQKANMAFGLLVQIRNKLQDSYDELKNLKV
jgi:flagellar hook-basal body complex protein FliE